MTKNGKGKAPPQKVGVIDAIVRQMARKNGASVSEIVKALVKKFPDRDERSMTTTTRIQVNQWPKKKGVELTKTKDEKRGTVYRIPEDALKLLK